MRAVRPQDGAAMGTYNLESLPQIHADLPALRDAMEVQFLAAIPDAGSRSRVASALHTTRTLMDGAMDRMNVPQGRVRTIVNTVSAGILATLVAWGGCRYIGPSAKRVERGSAPPPAGAGSQLPPSGEQGSRPPRAGESNSTSPPPSGAEQGSRPPRAATAPIDARIPKESASLGVPGRTHKFDVSASGGKLTVKFPDDVDPADVVLFVGLPNTKPQSVVPPNGTARGAKWDVALPTALNGAPVIGVGVSEYIGNSPQPTHGSLQLMKLN
jgi:hypothetical protein